MGGRDGKMLAMFYTEENRKTAGKIMLILALEMET